MSRALTVEQAAEYLQLSPYTIRQWLRTGKLPGRKIGRVYRILDSDLEALVGADRSQTADAVREKAAALDYPVAEAKPKARRKRRKPVGFGSLAHVAGLSSETYLKVEQDERERENRYGRKDIREILECKREEILRIAQTHGAGNVRIFGSVARGEADEKSDVDFLVDFEPGTSLLQHGALIAELEDLLGRKVDVAPEKTLKERVRAQALAEAIPL